MCSRSSTGSASGQRRRRRRSQSLASDDRARLIVILCADAEPGVTSTFLDPPNGAAFHPRREASVGSSCEFNSLTAALGMNEALGRPPQGLPRRRTVRLGKRSLRLTRRSREGNPSKWRLHPGPRHTACARRDPQRPHCEGTLRSLSPSLSPSVQEALDLELATPDSVRLIPVYLRPPGCPIPEFYQGCSPQLPPAPSTELRPETNPFTDGYAPSDHLDLGDLAGELEVHKRRLQPADDSVGRAALAGPRQGRLPRPSPSKPRARDARADPAEARRTRAGALKSTPRAPEGEHGEGREARCRRQGRPGARAQERSRR